MRVLTSALALLTACTIALHAPPAPAVAEPPGTPDPVGVWPLDPEPAVAKGFDPPSERWGAGHRGVDLAGRPGQVVRAALPGVVRFAGRIAGRGVVVVAHDATRTTYEPVEATVGLGDRVTAGAPVGRLSPIGSHCFPRTCLHWGWIEGDLYLDPLRLVGAGPVRLLPLDGQAIDRTRPVAAWRSIASLFGFRRADGPVGRRGADGRS